MAERACSLASTPAKAETGTGGVVGAALPDSASEAAVLCGIARSTWWKLHASGRCPLPVRLGRRTLWLREELDRWLAAGCPDRRTWIARSERR